MLHSQVTIKQAIIASVLQELKIKKCTIPKQWSIYLSYYSQNLKQVKWKTWWSGE